MTTPLVGSIEGRIAEELGVRERQVRAAVDLLDGGSTVPFIARYRKEATEMLDDAQLRTLEERLRYLRELEERRASILESVREQGKLTPEVEAQIRGAETKARLEDIYLPFKPKRRTKAQIAREAGLEPLAEGLLGDPSVDPLAAAAAFVDADKGVADPQAALDGARAILTERFSEDADLIGEVRERMWVRGRLAAKVKQGKEEAGAKFADYFDFAEPFTALPSHRILAMLRGEKEDVLDLVLEPEEETEGPSSYEGIIAHRFGIAERGRPGDKWLKDTVRWAWRTRILVHLGIDVRLRLRTVAEDEAVNVFAANLRDLLLAAPAGTRSTLGLDPGFRTGVKVAVVDATGKAVATDVIYPHVPANKWDEAIAKLARLAKEHSVDLIAIGNGTASRETDKLAGELITRHPELKLTKVMVSEAGASVYSASAFASQELPGMDVSLRGAVSIAPAPGSAGRAGEDRSEVDRGRAVPARSVRGEAVALAGRGGRGLCERCRGRRQHGVHAAAGAGLRHLRRARGEHRGAPGRQRAVHVTVPVEECRPARAEGVRAVCGVPADPGRGRSAGLVQCAPGGVSGGPADGEVGGECGGFAGREHGGAAVVAAR